jgi:eukaryotic-like serine/threonine-protein kinase
MALSQGTRLGAYELLSLLGRGGMGEVYRARDTKLNRDVAIKVLPEHLATEPERMSRFAREAQMASALNHPHILTVHDAGEFNGRQYLVTELVDGPTLKDYVHVPAANWREAVELLIGIADALATAHEAGILHRDIKPGNILITKTGYAKLADFGLAKVWGASTHDPSRTPTELATRAGAIVGTVAYMSPEQVLGRTLDARSDIFAFSVVVFEVLAGRRPFAGASDLDVMNAIVHVSPMPLPEHVPPALRMIIEKGLEKESANRFQSMREVVVELRRVVRHGDGPALPETSHRIGRPLRMASVTGVALAVAGAAALYLAKPPRLQPMRSEYTQLTNFADSATSPALSPDGRMLTFIRGESTFLTAGQIYVKLLPDGEPVPLTNDTRRKLSPRFSPDGSQIAYTVRESSYDTWTVSVLGRQSPRLFLSNASGLTWLATAGAQQPSLLFSEMTGRGAQMGIVSATESRAQHRIVYMPSEAAMAHRSYASPNGQQVLLAEMDTFVWLPCRLVPSNGGSSGRPVGPVPSHCHDAAWSPDGTWMYFSADTGRGFHIWRQRFPDGTPEQITSGVTEEEGISLAADGRSFVTSIGTNQSTVWIHDEHGDRQITSEGYSFLPSISTDSKKVYYLVRADGSEGMRARLSGALWVVDLESGQRQRLLPEFLIQQYSISQEGDAIVFVAADETGRSPLWWTRLNNRSMPRKLTTIDALTAFFSARGQVVFEGQENGATSIYQVQDDGSNLLKLMRLPALFLFGVSPDGKWVVAPGGTDELLKAVVVYAVNGSAARLVCKTCRESSDSDANRFLAAGWSPDGKFFYLRFEDATYAIPLHPGETMPPLPPSGFQKKEELSALPGARLIANGEVFPGPNPSVYAYVKRGTQRNIYRVPVP